MRLGATSNYSGVMTTTIYLLLPLVTAFAQRPAGGRDILLHGGSIVPGGFQQHIFQGSQNQRPSPTSIQNTQFGYFGSQLGSSDRRFADSKSGKDDVYYEYYEDLDDDLLYQYAPQHNIQQSRPKNPLPYHQQSITTANKGRGSRERARRPSGSQISKTPAGYVSLSEDSQSNQALSGRSVPALSNSRLSNFPVRPLTALIRPSVVTTTPSSVPSTTPTQRSRFHTLTAGRATPKPTRRTLNSKTFSSRLSSLSRERKLASTRSTTLRTVKEDKAYSLSAPDDSEDYTIEYIEYIRGPEDPEGPLAFEYYEVSEETAKELLARDNTTVSRLKTHKSKPSSTTTEPPTTSKSTTTTTQPSTTVTPKVVISVSTTKSVLAAGGTIKPTRTTEAPKVVTSISEVVGIKSATSSKKSSPDKKSISLHHKKSKSTVNLKNIQPSEASVVSNNSGDSIEKKITNLSGEENVSRESSKEVPSAEKLQSGDSVPSGAETSPEYYEEEYSYAEYTPSWLQKNSQLSQKDAVEQELYQPRKLPSKPSGNVNDFETLVDFEELSSEDKSTDREFEAEAKKASSTSTTIKPVEIKFAEIPLDLLPPGFKLDPSSVPTTTSTTPSTTTTTTTNSPKEPLVSFENIPASLLPNGFKPIGIEKAKPTISTTTTKPSSTTAASYDVKIDIGAIPESLLPKGYKLSTTTEAPKTAPPKNPLEALLSKVKFTEISIPGLVPKDFKEQTTSEAPNKPSTTEGLSPIKFEIPANLLPPGYKPRGTPASKTDTSSSTTVKPKGPVFPTRPSNGLVFPTRPGGKTITRPTTTAPSKGNTPPPPRVKIVGGWPTRKTTDFTGWPTKLTTPLPSTSEITSSFVPTTERTTTTTTPTTTTPFPKRSPQGTCPMDFCRMEATIRIVSGLKWKPEFSDINTEEYKHLELTIRRELDGAYRASGLAPYYKKVQIDSFNEGSVLVDYSLELEGIDRQVTNSDVLKVFHKALLDADPGDQLPNVGGPGALRFGRYNIDPRYTDFRVVARRPEGAEEVVDGALPQWGVAVIVIGVISLLFVIVLAIVILWNRRGKKKKKNGVVLTQEMLNEFNKSHMPPALPPDDLYNMDDVWDDHKQPERTFDRRPHKRGGYGKDSYNIYDSWRTDWNGYYYQQQQQQQHQSSGFYGGGPETGFSRRRSDYDTNF